MTPRINHWLFAMAALTVLGVMTWAAPALAQTFNINDGIVGNLSCIASGDCGWCDFIDLMVVLQKVILSLFGGLAIIMLIWGGQGLIMSGGSSEKVTASKKLITNTLFGVLIVLGGYAAITLTIAILTNPVGATTFQSRIFGTQAWQQAFCGSRSDPSFCQQRANGTPCTIDGASGNCSNKTCVSACEYKYGGSGYGCYEVTLCKNKNLIGSDLAGCTDANECYRGLCPGPTTTICCTTN